MNKHRYKKLSEQVIVITGASSGIGLATARRAAKAGAKLVLNSRNEEALQQISEQLRHNGAEVACVIGDIGDESVAKEIVETADNEFDGFDTWVNNAGVLVFSELKDLPVDEHERIFKTNYWGVVHGSTAAAEHFRDKENGGTIINVASINSQMPVSLLGAYSATKAAVKAYSDVLRMELMHEKAPVRVSVIMPSGISTPISDHGRSHLGERGKVMPPLYDAELVADAILTSARRPVREITVGETGRLITMAWSLMPAAMDRFISWYMPRAQSSGKPTLPTDNLFTAGEDGYVYLDGEPEGLRISPYTKGRMHLRKTLGLSLLVGAAVYVLNSEKRRNALKKQAQAVGHQVGDYVNSHVGHSGSRSLRHHVGGRSLRHPMTRQQSMKYRLQHPIKSVQQAMR